MASTVTVNPIDLRSSPLELAGRWPADRPLLMLHSGQQHPVWGRWTIVAEARGWVRITPDGSIETEGEVPGVETNGQTLVEFDHLLAAGCDVDRGPEDACSIPFVGGWIGGFGYELGGLIEPATTRERDGGSGGTGGTGRWPLAELAWCPAGLVFDHVNQQWWEVHPTDTRPVVDLLRGSGTVDRTAGDFQAGPLMAASSDVDHLCAIERTLEYIRAGDIFQANITRRYHCDFVGEPRVLLRAAMEVGGPRYGAYLELPGGRYVVSISPESFLQFDAKSRRVVSRPIKGTRPAGIHPTELVDSAKDAAELHMIVDLMRNDLGRVCEFGSVRVDEPRMIESHAAVHHGVAQVSGTLRNDATVMDLLRATFPAGSITGAPKIRAMQVISELEGRPRDWYCGAMGWISRDGSLGLNVGIRTLLLERGTLSYCAGGGIVADSVPAEELAECEQKTEVLRATLRRLRAEPTSLVGSQADLRSC